MGFLARLLGAIVESMKEAEKIGQNFKPVITTEDIPFAAKATSALAGDPLQNLHVPDITHYFQPQSTPAKTLVSLIKNEQPKALSLF